MSIIAPSAPHVGPGSLSRHSSSGSDSAAHVLATIVDMDPSTALPAQLSLKGLLHSENVQLIQENLAVLARFADHLPRELDAAAPRVTNDELLIMGNLVRDISNSLEKIESLREDEVQVLPYVADKYVPVRPVSSVARRRRKEEKKLQTAQKCHNCNRLDTPQWRAGPDGPRTLCNVCGLVYTKRQRRQVEQMMRPLRRLTTLK
ncbi:transcription factor rfeH-Penicillium chrysogenum [Cordyceps militaris]|uniref:Transcription factor rfeH-Penicillium chrysogenum n=1 Tax=Cordyceps militaris TaxID=73501 RepID=A0A2H4S902_CORMI|nr:transcription factor rfeH-Penicillium chrysogenum [Cordyceps militaris]